MILKMNLDKKKIILLYTDESIEEKISELENLIKTEEEKITPESILKTLEKIQTMLITHETN